MKHCQWCRAEAEEPDGTLILTTEEPVRRIVLCRRHLRELEERAVRYTVEEFLRPH
jgi:hypothetical protein